MSTTKPSVFPHQSPGFQSCHSHRHWALRPLQSRRPAPLFSLSVSVWRPNENFVCFNDPTRTRAACLPARANHPFVSFGHSRIEAALSEAPPPSLPRSLPLPPRVRRVAPSLSGYKKHSIIFRSRSTRPDAVRNSDRENIQLPPRNCTAPLRTGNNWSLPKECHPVVWCKITNQVLVINRSNNKCL